MPSTRMVDTPEDSGSALSGKDPFENRQSWSLRCALCGQKCCRSRNRGPVRSSAQLFNRMAGPVSVQVETGDGKGFG